jgi:RND superfamily putative drug exporter
MFAGVGRWSFRHRWATIGAWLFALVLITGVGSALIGSAYSSEMEIPASESASGFDVLDEFFADQGGSGLSGSIVYQSAAGVDDPAVQSAMTQLFADVDAIDGVTVLSPYAAFGGQQINGDGTIAYATVNLEPGIDEVESTEIGKEIVDMLPSVDGLRIEVGGSALAEFEPPESELIGLAFAVVVLIVAFGSVLAMGLPIGVALAGVVVGIGAIGLISNVMTVPDFSTTLGAMIGLGVGIDYALFIVTRYREGTRHGLSPEEATITAMDTAGRAVLFAGLTVVISLLGMLLIGLEFIAGLGIAAATTVAVTMTASLTLLPALLGLARERVEVTRWRGLIAAGLVAVALLGLGLKLPLLSLVAVLAAALVLLAAFAVAPLRRQVAHRPPKPLRETGWYRWSHRIQDHPWQSLGAGAVLLGVLAVPVFGLRLGFSDEGNFPQDTTTRQAYDLLADGFGPGFNGPLVVAVTLDSTADASTLPALADAFRAADGVQSVSPPIPDDPEAPRAALIQVIPTSAPQDAATDALIDRLRDDVVPAATAGTGATAYITGFTAAGVDFTSYLAKRIVVFFAVVLLLSFLLLMMVFRSLLVPLKAVIMNVISIAASYGVVVAVFQWGWLSGVFGVEPAPIEPFIPMMMFAIVFGLSMDYEVFLLSRVKEEYDRTGDAKNSVADGLAATARVITAAAAIMVVVFGSFLLEENRVVKLFGLGLAVAVLLDATLVRMLLVPATMELLGEKNWWLPRWLDRILPSLNVEGPVHTELWDDQTVLDVHGDSDDDSGDGEREPALTGRS